MLNGRYFAVAHCVSRVGSLSLAINDDFAPNDFISVLDGIPLLRAYQILLKTKSQQIIPAGKVSFVDW